MPSRFPTRMQSRLFRHFILRRMAEERARTITTVIGIALGIAVVLAIQLTNASSVRGFEAALTSVAGRTSVEILGSGGIDETRLTDLGWLRGFGAMSPVIEGEMAIVTGSENRARRTEAVKVLGVDILQDLTLRDYVLDARGEGSEPGGSKPGGSKPEGSEPGGSQRQGSQHQGSLTSQQFLELLTSPRAIVITEKLARRRGYALGDELQLMAGDRVNTFVIRGLLEDEGPATVMDGSFVLMDIAAAQLAFDRLGRIDRLDVQLTGAGAGDNALESVEIDAALSAIAARLPAGLTAQRPSRRGEQVERMLAAFHLNLTALSWVALVVGLFLVYNTVTISVIARRDEIGMLRALGVTRRQVLGLFLGEAAVLGLAGTLVGIGLGRVLADTAVGLTRSTVSTLYIATAASTPALAWWHVALAFAIGLPLSLLAASLPSLEASRVPPTAAMRGSDRLESRVRLRLKTLIAPALVLAAAFALSQLGPIDGRPLFGYAASFATIIGASLLVPAIIYLMARSLAGVLRRLLGVEGLLAHANLAAAIPRLSISVAALSVSLSMMVAVAVMIGSFRDTVAYWVGQTLQADLFIGPGVQPTVGSEQTLSAPVIEAVESHPGVEAVDSFRNVDLVYNGNLVVLGAGNFDIVLSHGALLFKSPADGREALRRAIGTESVVVSEAFANKYGTRPGDTLTLQTPKGPRPFAVAAVYYDYAVDRGVIVMDRATFTRYFGDLTPTGIAAYLKPGFEPERVRADILGGLDEGHRAFIYTNRDLRAEVLRVFDSTFAITYALEIIAILVAMLGVGATLLTLVLERRRDLSMLRLIGAARRQVQRVIVIEAALIGAASQAIGLVVGLALSVLLVYVINVQSFGWTIQFRVPVVFLAQVSVAVIVATAIAGIYPARRAATLVVDHDE
jgi:putative ABC transport system permease protein